MDDIFVLSVNFPYSDKWKPNELYFPGTGDDITGILKSEILFGEVDASIKHLFDIGNRTIINLDMEYQRNKEAELLVQGIPVALGEIVTVDEYYGLRIKEVYHKQKEKINVTTSDYLILAEEETKECKIKVYDFKKPEKFAYYHIKKITKLHQSYMRNLKLLVSDLKDYKVTALDLIYGELMKSLSADDYSVIGINNSVYRSRKIKTNEVYGQEIKAFEELINKKNEWFKNSPNDKSLLWENFLIYYYPIY